MMREYVFHCRGESFHQASNTADRQLTKLPAVSDLISHLQCIRIRTLPPEYFVA